MVFLSLDAEINHSAPSQSVFRCKANMNNPTGRCLPFTLRASISDLHLLENLFSNADYLGYLWGECQIYTDKIHLIESSVFESRGFVCGCSSFGGHPLTDLARPRMGEMV